MKLLYFYVFYGWSQLASIINMLFLVIKLLTHYCNIELVCKKLVSNSDDYWM